MVMGLTYLILFTYASNVAPARPNGRPMPRRNIRRAVPSEFLTPPAPLLPLNRPANNFRHGKILTPQPTKGTESPGYLSQLMGYLGNPFRDQQPPRPAQKNGNIHGGFLQPPPPPSSNYGPPAPTVPQPPPVQLPQYQPPQAPSPSTGQAYSPPLNIFGRSCDPCNTVPWIPIHQNVDVPQVNPGYGSPEHHNVPVQADLHVAPPLDVKQPDFSYGVPNGAISNPHMYPGAVPPLFKATAFDTHSADSGVSPEVVPFEGNQNSGQNLQVASLSFEAHVTENQRNNQFGQGPNQFQEQTHGSNQFQEQTHGSNQFQEHSQSSNQFQEHTQSSNQFQEQTHGSKQFQEHSQSSNQFQDQTQGYDQVPNQQFQGSQDFDQPSGPSGNSGYVDVLPPGAEVSGSDSSAFDSTHQISEVASASAQIETSDPPSPTRKPHSFEIPSGHIIHVEQSPVIDLSKEDSENLESPVILQNPDGTYGINATWPNGDSSRIWSAESAQASNEAPEIFQNVNLNLTDSAASSASNNYRTAERTTESLIKSVIKSYNTFEKEINSLDRGQSYGNRKLNLKEFSTISLLSQESQEFTPRSTDRQAGTRKNKVQIIIPYTSDHMPTPFHTHRSSDENISRAQERSVMPDNHNPVDQEFKAEEEDIGDVNSEEEEEEDEELEEVEDLKKLFNASWTQKKEESTVKPTTAKANTSIDVLRLQKNIDNWTIQEYSRGTTATTSTPIYSHQLLQSKKIPDEYLTTEAQQPVPESRGEKSLGNILEGFNFNDLEHEGSASSRVDFSNVQSDVSSNSLESSESSTIPSDISYGSNEDVSWEQLPVSISPLSNERVYVVTPQTALKPAAFNSSNDSNKINNNNNSNNSSSSKLDNAKNSTSANSTVKFDSIEKSYQVLPQAVNNLAVVSTGPATVPLWGIMEHEEYASFNKTSPKTLVLYSGHSKVSHARS
ncbi:putative uncharacterized protein DDB_G0279653 isoform X2 [Cotesia glomerata]|uniref:Uncharacterized protein n=1 Tax=Cotesia glomerata TaxID=32391 RepID=A0AAV7IUL5_COTGL|nr:putative uncharacterized protein DDB_G0279653 isoform X2 [Cotesia glomerata]KAH0557787.1 hypothetical protein KQX54_011715 [Cotesia glomerata]